MEKQGQCGVYKLFKLGKIPIFPRSITRILLKDISKKFKFKISSIKSIFVKEFFLKIKLFKFLRI